MTELSTTQLRQVVGGVAQPNRPAPAAKTTPKAAPEAAASATPTPKKRPKAAHALNLGPAPEGSPYHLLSSAQLKAAGQSIPDWAAEIHDQAAAAFRGMSGGSETA